MLSLAPDGVQTQENEFHSTTLDQTSYDDHTSHDSRYFILHHSTKQLSTHIFFT